MFDCPMRHCSAFTIQSSMHCSESKRINASFFFYFKSLLFNIRGFFFKSEKFPIQKSRSSFFSMNQWRGLFNTCRIPQLNKDRLDIHFKTGMSRVIIWKKKYEIYYDVFYLFNCLAKESNECPTHLIVMYKYRFYRLETYHQGKQLNITELYRQLEKIVANGDKKAFGVGIGALTADKRDSWAKVNIISCERRKNLEICLNYCESYITYSLQ